MKMVSYLNHPHLCHPPTVSNHSPSSVSGNISLSFSAASPHVVLFTTKKGLFSNCQPRMMTDRNYGICHPNLFTVLRKGIMVWWKPDTKKVAILMLSFRKVNAQDDFEVLSNLLAVILIPNGAGMHLFLCSQNYTFCFQRSYFTIINIKKQAR